MFVIIIIIYLITTVWQGQVMWKNQQLQHEQTMYDYLTKSQQQYLDYIIKRDDDIRKFRHDIRAHMIIMRSMAERNDMDGLLAYINEVDDLTQKKQAQQFTGNSTIDAIINDLHTRMEQGNIEFGVNGHIHIEGDEKIFDISICMYNILLNAIEALEKLESKDKLIKLDISQYQKKLYFKISNNCMIKENCEDITALDTDKEDKLNHGIGSKNVAEIVERNNGKLLYSVKNGLFITELLI